MEGGGGVVNAPTSSTLAPGRMPPRLIISSIKRTCASSLVSSPFTQYPWWMCLPKRYLIPKS